MKQSTRFTLVLTFLLLTLVCIVCTAFVSFVFIAGAIFCAYKASVNANKYADIQVAIMNDDYDRQSI